MLKAVADGSIPELLSLGGEEAFDAYRAVFDGVYRSPKPIFDVRGYAITFGPDACRHVCYVEDRFDKRRKRAEGDEPVREEWDQSRAEHILWILATLMTPSEIMHNHQVGGYEAYLLGFPRGDFKNPARRYYVSVKPTGDRRREFRTGYPIDLRYWNNARRGPTGKPHAIYRRPTPRW